MIHASDIANGSFYFPTYIRWSILLMQEFNHQFETENKNNIKPSGFMKYQNKQSFYKGQIFFLSKFN